MLTVAWVLFSGTTRYVSLATAAFFGLGAYTMAVLSESDIPIYGIFAVTLLVGAAIAPAWSAWSHYEFRGCSSSFSGLACPK